MKILCLADDIDPLVHSPNLKERFGFVDLVLGAGDLSVDYYEYVLTILNRPLYFVFGNHHLQLFDHFKKKNFASFINDHKSYGSQCIDGKTAVIKEKRQKILLLGLGGCKTYNKGKSQYSEFAMALLILKNLPTLLFNKIRYGRYLDILLTHTPPYQLGDRDGVPHKGFKIFRWFLRQFKPQYMLYGHIHLWDANEERVLQYEETTLINVYNHYVLELNNE